MAYSISEFPEGGIFLLGLFILNKINFVGT